MAPTGRRLATVMSARTPALRGRRCPSRHPSVCSVAEGDPALTHPALLRHRTFSSAATAALLAHGSGSVEGLADDVGVTGAQDGLVRMPRSRDHLPPGKTERDPIRPTGLPAFDRQLIPPFSLLTTDVVIDLSPCGRALEGVGDAVSATAGHRPRGGGPTGAPHLMTPTQGLAAR